MTTFPGSSRLLKGGIVLQYNPKTLRCTLQVQGVGGKGGDRPEALALKGPTIETSSLAAQTDVTGQLERGLGLLGIYP